MFEGKPEHFWASLQRLRDLPDEMAVYCAHEYTAANAKFALSVESNNHFLRLFLISLLASFHIFTSSETDENVAWKVPLLQIFFNRGGE